MKRGGPRCLSFVSDDLETLFKAVHFFAQNVAHIYAFISHACWIRAEKINCVIHIIIFRFLL